MATTDTALARLDRVASSIYIGLRCGNCGGREERGSWAASNRRRLLRLLRSTYMVPYVCAQGEWGEGEGSVMQPPSGCCSLE